MKKSNGLKRTERILCVLMTVIMAVTLAPQSLLKSFGVQTEAEAATTLNNPKIVADSSMKAGQKVTYDCVWFGSYPQTEIVDQARTSGCYGKKWSTSSDYEVNPKLYEALQKASYNANGDTTIGNTKYRRIKKSDTTYSTNGARGYYDWPNNNTYHYFRYEPIKWRVLNVNGGKALLLADVALDDQRYNLKWEGVNWRRSTIRSWLNGFDDLTNDCGIDYTHKNFIDSAFNSNEKNAIVSSKAASNNSFSYSRWNSDDKVFLLSNSDLCGTDAAKSYGFVTDERAEDEAKKSNSSTFAKAMGTYSYGLNERFVVCSWWLQSTGKDDRDFASEVHCVGFVDTHGQHVSADREACRPAIYLNLSASNLYSYAGTVCTDGTVKESAAPSGGADDHGRDPGKGEITKQPTVPANPSNNKGKKSK